MPAPIIPRTRRSRRVAAALAVVAGLAGPLAHAGPPAPTPTGNEALAETRFREASEAFDAGRVDEACTAFDASLRLFPTLGTLLNLALCREKQGKTASAWIDFTYAAAWANDAAQHDRREFARQHAARLERGLVRVQIDCPSGPPVHLDIDGQPLLDASRALPIFLDPGRHVITASAPGRLRFESTVTVGARPSEAPVVKIPPLKEDANKDSVTGPGRDPSAFARGPRRTLGWILGGLGIASASAAIYFGVDGLSRVRSDPAQATTSEALSMVLFGTGLTAAAAGAWLALWPLPVAASGTARVYVVPQVAPRSGGAGLVGLW